MVPPLEQEFFDLLREKQPGGFEEACRLFGLLWREHYGGFEKGFRKRTWGGPEDLEDSLQIASERLTSRVLIEFGVPEETLANEGGPPPAPAPPRGLSFSSWGYRVVRDEVRNANRRLMAARDRDPSRAMSDYAIENAVAAYNDVADDCAFATAQSARSEWLDNAVTQLDPISRFVVSGRHAIPHYIPVTDVGLRQLINLCQLEDAAACRRRSRVFAASRGSPRRCWSAQELSVILDKSERTVQRIYGKALHRLQTQQRM